MRKCLLICLLVLSLLGCSAEMPQPMQTFEQPAQTAVQEVSKSNDIPEPTDAQREEEISEETLEESKEQKQPEKATEETIPTCTVSISCKKLLEQIHLCDPEVAELLPEDGWILPPVTVEWIAGESVLDLLLRVCHAHGILVEYSDTPLYQSGYMEGIANLYEFDAGPLSGWMYSVNGVFPGYGCSRYLLQENDVVCWEFTCDLGGDIGGAQR